MLWIASLSDIAVIGWIADCCNGGGIDEESTADVFPVRQSSEGGACSVARAAVWPGLGARGKC